MTVSKGVTQRLVVADLAEAKGLPLTFLRGLGLEDLSGRGVAIPYRDRDGCIVAVKERTALAAGDGSWWPRGLPLMAYGLDRLHEARARGVLLIVEGESDSWVLWLHGFPALGIPGAGAAKVLDEFTSEDFIEIDNVFVHQEPGPAGGRFAERVPRKLLACGYTGSTFVFSIPGFKDPADLHVALPEGFVDILEAALARGRLWHPADSESTVKKSTSRDLVESTVHRSGLRVVRLADAPRRLRTRSIDEERCRS